MLREGYLLVVVVAVALVVGGCAGLRAKGPSDAELVSQVMHEWKAAWEEKDVGRVMACLSPSMGISDGGGPDDVRNFAERFSQGPENKIEMALDEMEISLEKETASVRGVRGTMSGRNREGNQFSRQFGLSLGLRKEEGKWLITWLEAWGVEG